MIGVYINKGIKEKLKNLREWTEDKGDSKRIIIRGDFNARTGREGESGGRRKGGGKEFER